MRTTILHETNTILTIDEVATPQECDEWIALAEGIGFTDAPITTARGFVMAPEIRNNRRVILDDAKRADALWERLASAIPERPGYRAIGLNERLRFYRYSPGQHFAWHRDGAYQNDHGHRSQLTLMVYLNDGFQGGETEFDVGERLAVRPRRGMALVFSHPVRHQGAAVKSGRKYVLRTDVMFARERPLRSVPEPT
jgi:prolyl 4-hydroxylase